MALNFEELEAITNDYFIADNRKAIDIYFDDCFLLDYFMNKKKGIWERPNGGRLIRIPVSYDGQEADFYTRGEALSSDDRENLQAAFYAWKNAYGNATVYRQDELENAGEYAEVQLAVQRLEGAQKSARKKIADYLYARNSDNDKYITGLGSCCFGASSAAYGGIKGDDLVAADGTKPWSAQSVTDEEAITLAAIRTLRSKAKVSDGANGKPDIGTTTETLFNVISGILQVQQRFTENKDVADAGFTNIVFEGMTIASDGYVPDGEFYALNSKYVGFAIHKNGFFAREPWGKIPNIAGKTMKIFWDGNLVVSNRKAHVAHSNLK